MGATVAPIVVGAVAAVLALAMLVRATVGFGDALLAMPVLTLLIGVRAAVPLVTALSLTVAVVMLVREGRGAVSREALLLLAGAVPGVPVGVVLLRSLPEVVLGMALGLTVSLYGGWRAVRLFRGRHRSWSPPTRGAPRADATPRDVSRRAGRLATVAGFASGAFGAATGAGGPPVVMYGVARGWPPTLFRGTLQAYFLCAGCVVLMGYVAAGLWTPLSTRLYVAALPGVLVAVVVGSTLAGRLPTERFARLVTVCLVVVGVGLLAASLR